MLWLLFSHSQCFQKTLNAVSSAENSTSLHKLSSQKNGTSYLHSLHIAYQVKVQGLFDVCTYVLTTVLEVRQREDWLIFCEVGRIIFSYKTQKGRILNSIKGSKCIWNPWNVELVVVGYKITSDQKEGSLLVFLTLIFSKKKI